MLNSQLYYFYFCIILQRDNNLPPLIMGIKLTPSDSIALVHAVSTIGFTDIYAYILAQGKFHSADVSLYYALAKSVISSHSAFH